MTEMVAGAAHYIVALVGFVLAFGCDGCSKSRQARSPARDEMGPGVCWLDPARGAGGSPDLRLFVTGLNHGADVHRTVDQRGIDALVFFLANDPGDPESILVVLSSSNTEYFNCEPGPKMGRDGIGRNGECLAFALEKRLGTPFEIVEANMADGGWNSGGYAVILGSRWRVVDTAFARPEVGAFLKVMIEDRRNHCALRRFSLYVLHAAGNDESEPLLRAVSESARSSWNPETELPPIIAGDFNIPGCDKHGCKDGRQCKEPDDTCTCLTQDCAPKSFALLAPNWTWPAHWFVCPEQPGVSCPSQGVRAEVIPARACQLNVDFSIQAVVGKHVRTAGDSADPAFIQARAHFERVRMSFSHLNDSEPATTTGVTVPNVAHNVVAVGFDLISDGGEICQRGARCVDGACSPEACACEEPRRLGARCGLTDDCGKTCVCNEDLVCRRGSCVHDGPNCGRRTCTEQQYCCAKIGPNGTVTSAQCCGPNTNCSIITGQCVPNDRRDNYLRETPP